MRIFQLDDSLDFPHPELAHPEGLLAYGGDLSPLRILKAYSMGIFPWYEEGQPILWWSPNPRLIVYPEKIKVSKSLRQLINRNKFKITFDTSFEAVMRSCANTRRKEGGNTWITEDLIQSFVILHRSGLAHSVETWYEGKLVGGLYGLSLGKVFFGESMFHTHDNASKVAFVHLGRFLLENGIKLIDVQQDTPHLRSLGGEITERANFLNLLHDYCNQTSLVGNWGTNNITKMQIRF